MQYIYIYIYIYIYANIYIYICNVETTEKVLDSSSERSDVVLDDGLSLNIRPAGLVYVYIYIYI